MQKLLNKVKEFHEKFDIPLRNEFSLIDTKEYELRYALMKEENEEYLTACHNSDKIEIADALGDKLYILLGTIVQHGFQDKIEEVFNLIHDNNMSKLDEHGNVIRDANGKVRKPDNFKPVDLSKVVNND